MTDASTWRSFLRVAANGRFVRAAGIRFGMSETRLRAGIGQRAKSVCVSLSRKAVVDTLRGECR